MLSANDSYGSVGLGGTKHRSSQVSLRRAAFYMVGVLVAMAALAFGAVTLQRGWRKEVVLKENLAIGPLGRTQSDAENILGSLAMTTNIDESSSQHSAKVGNIEKLMHKGPSVDVFKKKASHLAKLEQSLKAQEQKVREMEEIEEKNYRAAVLTKAAKEKSHRDSHSASIPLKAKSVKVELVGIGASSETKLSSVTASSPIMTKPKNEAAEVAKLVLSALEPQLSAQQAEISHLSSMVHKSSFGAQAHQSSVAVAAASRESGVRAERQSFQDRMARYLQGTKAATTGLNMVDYRQRNDIEHGQKDPGLGAEPAMPPRELGIKAYRPSSLPRTVSRGSMPWRVPKAKGGPCSVAGACDHSQFEPDQETRWRNHFLTRYEDWTTDGNGYPARHRAPFHRIETHLATNKPSNDAVIPALDFEESVVEENIPSAPKTHIVVSVEGNLHVNSSGYYTFCISSSDRSVLFVDNLKAVSNEGRPDRGSDEPEKEECGKVGLTVGVHTIRAVEFQAHKPVSFAATYSGKDTKGAKKAVPSNGWVLRVYPSLPRLWDKWFQTYSPKFHPVEDHQFMASPLGEEAEAKGELKGKQFVQPKIADLPSKDYFVTIAGVVKIKKSGPYYFCSPGKDGTLLFVDDRKALQCPHPTIDAEEHCGSLHLLAGVHVVKAAILGGNPDDKGEYFTYSGKDTEYEPKSLESPKGWTIRAFRAPEKTWRKWYKGVCRRPGEAVRIGDEELMHDLDDFIPPNDAYIHDQLTSGNYGYDHFGNLEPMSKENQDMMYGNDFHHALRQVEGKKIHSPGRGGHGHFAEPKSLLGDDQIDDDDREVPVAIAKGDFPGPDPDRFDHWPWNSSVNQELLNGRYWKHLKRDGLMDRLTPANEAYAQLSGTSHDRHPISDLAVGSWNLGHGHGPSVWGPRGDVYGDADRKLMADKAGETSAPTPDMNDESAIHKKVPALPDKDFVQVATGRLVVKLSGTYQFCTTGADTVNPNVLFVDGRKLVDNVGVEGVCGSVGLAAGPHSIRAVTFQEADDGTFNATYSGADTAAAAGLALAAAPNASLPSKPDWRLRAYRTSRAAWDDWLGIYRASPRRAAWVWSEEHPEPWVRSRQETQGKGWRNRVFTGTHERIEDHRGITQNHLHDDAAYF